MKFRCLTTYAASQSIQILLISSIEKKSDVEIDGIFAWMAFNWFCETINCVAFLDEITILEWATTIEMVLME